MPGFGSTPRPGLGALALDDEWRHMVDPALCAREGHLPTLTKGWRGYRLRCWRCSLKLGPWRDRNVAEQARRLFDGPMPSA